MRLALNRLKDIETSLLANCQSTKGLKPVSLYVRFYKFPGDKVSKNGIILDAYNLHCTQPYCIIKLDNRQLRSLDDVNLIAQNTF